MQHTNRSVIARNTPLRLTPEQIDEPREVLTAFFGELSLDEAREILWESFARAICSQDEPGGEWSAKELFYFHGAFEAVLEAAFLLQREK